MASRSYCRAGLEVVLLFLCVYIGSGKTKENRGQSILQEVANENDLFNSVEFVWSRQTVAVGDTAVLHCSFEAILSRIRNGKPWPSSRARRLAGRRSMIDWVKEPQNKGEQPKLIAAGNRVVLPERRFKIFRPHKSALSVLIIRRTKKRDAGVYRCNLSGSRTRYKYLILNVTVAKIDAKTSPAKVKAYLGKDVTLWCNATGYPRPIVYWTREDTHRQLQDGSYQRWGNGLTIYRASPEDTGIYGCYMDNYVRPVVSFKFSVQVEDPPWTVEAYTMRYDNSRWFSVADKKRPLPVWRKTYLLMCETRGSPDPVPEIKWYKDGRKLRNSKRFYIIVDKPEWRSNYVSSTLVIKRFTERMLANFTCAARNQFRVRKARFYIQDYLVDMPEEGDRKLSSTTVKPSVTTVEDDVWGDEEDDDEENDRDSPSDDEDYDVTSGHGPATQESTGRKNDDSYSNVIRPKP